MKHTQGPWTAHLEKPKKKKGIYNPPMSLVVTNSNSERATAIDCTCSGASKEEDDANARLIAAAPELLHALECALGDIAQRSGIHLHEAPEWFKSSYFYIYKAITKANGGTA